MSSLFHECVCRTGLVPKAGQLLNSNPPLPPAPMSMVTAFPSSPSSIVHLSHLHICTKLLLPLRAQPDLPQCYFAPHVNTVNII